jgi:hypothetical protein
LKWSSKTRLFEQFFCLNLKLIYQSSFQIVKKSIEVAKLVLPTFQVHVQATKCMHVRIKATYPSGKPVVGSATIKAIPIVSCVVPWKSMDKPVIKTVNCVDETEVVFEKSDFSDRTYDQIIIQVIVQEKVTGVVVQASDVIIPHKPKSVKTELQKKLLHTKLINQPNLHEKLKVKVRFSQKLSTLFYYIVGRGRILLSKEVCCKDVHKKFIDITPTSAMAPESQLVVYYIGANGEIVSDVVKLVFADQTSFNFVSSGI